MDKIIDCEIEAFLRKEKGRGNCKLVGATGTFIEVHNSQNVSFNDHFQSLRECLAKNGVVPVDLRQDNTLWLEMYTNANGGSGFGKKLLIPLIQKAIASDYKYIFAYPSSSLGGDKANQDLLINRVYIPLGFRLLKSCIFVGFDAQFNQMTFEQARRADIRTNAFDNGAPYHLVFAKLTDLNLDKVVGKDIQVIYRKKYLKYKAKYLALKKFKI